MNIVIAAPFCSLPGEAYFNRFLYLAEYLSQEHEVTLMTSRFRHHDKTFRQGCGGKIGRLNVKLLDETGYRRNVSLARVFSHRRFVRELAREVGRWQAGEVDVVYSAYPLMATNLLLGRHKARVGYKLIIDVQDVWPESFSAVVPFIKKLPPRLLPFARRADAAYRAADALAAVSHTYLARARAANPDVPAMTAYIGADGGRIAQIAPYRFDIPRTRLFYLGTLSHSYDLATVCRAVQMAAEGGADIELHIIGGGPQETVLRRRFAGSRIVFHGMLAYDAAIALAKGCDIAVNPIHGHAMQSITNKLSDYLLLGKPVLNSQTGGEVRNVLSLLPAAHYPSGDAEACAAAIGRLRETPAPDSGAQHALHRLFDRRLSYPPLAEWIVRQGTKNEPPAG
ncbi:glycosyltransferase [Neisseria leonii]|uniref:Glycosyltransferase n=1 Tax=Neisseria leonii TaxID=2995413 RepID=A0A9X4E5I2_9NEIS|nr:glycosyltransferase [Neisseria sp. 51.81]MDD9328276.1 glycosyltransferase [Neisseria sp. 51.81]